MKNKNNFIRQAMQEQGIVKAMNGVVPPMLQESEPEKEPETPTNPFLPPNSSKEELKEAIVQRVMEKIQQRIIQEQTQPQEQPQENEQGTVPAEGQQPEEQQAPQQPQTPKIPTPADLNDEPQVDDSSVPTQDENGKDEVGDDLIFDDEENIQPAENVTSEDEESEEPSNDDSVNADNLVVGSIRKIIADDKLSLDTVVDENNLEEVLNSLENTFSDASEDDDKTIDDAAEEAGDEAEEEEDEKPKSKGKKNKDPKNHVLDVVHNLLETVKTLVEKHPVKKASLNVIANNAIHIACKYIKAEEFPTQHALDYYLKQHPDADKSNHTVKQKEPEVKNTEPEKKPMKQAPKAPPESSNEEAPKKRNYSKKEINEAIDAFNSLPHDDPDAERIKNTMSQDRDFSPANMKKQISDWYFNKKNKNAPAQEAPKTEAPKQEAPKVEETPKVEPKPEAPKVEEKSQPKEEPKKEDKQQETPKTEETKPEPNPEAPKAPAKKNKPVNKVDDAYAALSKLPKDQRDKIETDALENSASTEDLDNKISDWHEKHKAENKPLDPSDEKQMKSKGYAKKKVDELNDDTTFTDVSTGKKIKFSELPKSVQDKLKKKNEKGGLWHTPPKPKEEVQPKKESPKQEAPKTEKPKTEAPKSEEKSQPKTEKKTEAPKVEKTEPKKEEPTPEPEPVDPPELKRYTKDEVNKITDKHKPFEVKEAIGNLKNKIFKKKEPPKDLKVWLSKKPTVKDLIDNIMKWHKSSGGKAASQSLAANHIVYDFISDKIASEFVNAVKDKDLMSDTGGKSKSNKREPHFKPSRTDLKTRYKDKSLTKEEKDPDIQGDKDLA